jgi:nucleoside-diphosphate-sugar epimerase
VKALVTGGGGFLGRAITLQLLDRDDQVAVFSRRRFEDLEAKGATSLQGDLADFESVRAACEGCDVVFHVAALAGAWGPAEAYERTNVLGTENVIRACKEAGVGRLVFTSSPSAISPPEMHHHEGVDESVPYPTKFLAHYPRTKAASEQAALAANGDALKVCALRPHLIIGPGDPHLLPRVIARVKQGRLRIVGEGHNLVDFTYVEDAARAHLLAADALRGKAPAAGKAYFITQGDPTPLWPWLNDLLEEIGLPRITKTISAAAAMRLGATLETVWRWLRLSGEPPMTRFVAVQLATSHWFDISAARRDLGYAPRHSMGEVTRIVAEYYREGEGKALVAR